MKKLIVFLLLVLTPIMAFAVLKGDVDGNDKVGSSDYVLVRKHILGQSLLTGDKLTRADVNGDGKVSSLDFVSIRKIIIDGGSTQTITPTPTNTPVPATATPTPPTSKVTGVSFSKSDVNLEIGDSYKLSYTISPSNAANKGVSFSSNNTKIATVSSDGTVTTGNVFGTAKITVTTSDGGHKAEVTINVSKERMHFINIGEAGNAILLDSYYGGKNHYVLIDAATCKGNVDCGSKQIDTYIGKKVQPVKSDGTFNTAGGVKKIDAVIVTHMHYDHAGYMAKIIEKYKPDKVIIKKYSVSKDYLSGIKSAAKKAGSTIVYPSEGSEYVFGNYKLKIYNTTDVVGSRNYSENINSLVTMVSTTMGDRTYLSYLPGDLEIGKDKSSGAMIYDAAALSKRIQSDFGLSASRPVDIYVAAHHAYYNDDGSTGLGIAKGVNNNASVIEPLYIKSAVVPNTFGWLCSKTNDEQYQGLYNIYKYISSNGGDLNIRFSGAKRVKAIFRSKGISIDGGEVLSCNSSTCASSSTIHNAIKKAAPQCERKNYVK